MTVDKRELFLNAWAIYRGQKVKSFSDALKRSWREMKAACFTVVEKIEETFKEQKMEQSSFFFFEPSNKMERGSVLQ